MTAPIDIQIREYTRFFDAELPEIDVRDLLIETSGSDLARFQRPPRPRQRQWLVAAAAAAVVLLLGLAPVLLFSGSDDPADEPATTVLEPAPVDVESLGTGWTSAPLGNVSGPGEGQVPFAAVNTTSGLVAMSQEVEFRADGTMMVEEPVIWVSRDGLSWTRRSAVGFGGGIVFDMTAGGPGLVVVGTASGFAAIWTSLDGVEWSRVPHDEDVFPGCAEETGGDCDAVVEWVVAGDFGMVGTGGGGGEDESLLWYSVDGMNWMRLDLDPEVFDPACLGLNHLVAFAGGAAARGDTSEECGDAAVWVTDNGLKWTRGADIPMDGPIALASRGSRLVAVAVDGPQDLGAFESVNLTDSALWWSDGAVEWFPASVTGVESGRGEVAISDVMATQFGFIATFHGDFHSTILVSSDGQVWLEIDTDLLSSDRTIRTITDGGPGLLAFGTDPSTPDSGIWVWSPPD